jgi:signal transduction histidine kinase
MRRLPPTIKRIPPRWCTGLLWGAVAALALATFATMSTQPVPMHLFLPPRVNEQVQLSRWTLGVTAAAMALPLGFARRSPVPVLYVVLAEAALSVGLGQRPWTYFAAVDVLVLFVVATRSRLAAAVAALAAPVVWACGSVASAPYQRLADLTRADETTLLTVIAWIIGFAIRQRRGYGDARREWSTAQAVTAERLRIARELHDMIAHSVSIIALQAGAAGRCLETQPAEARSALTAIEITSRETLAGLRRMLGALRDADADPAAGLDGIDRMAAAAAQAGVTVAVEWHGSRRPLPPEIDRSAFRVIQESVTNVVRHAGTRHCRVSIDQRGEELTVEIVDDGCGGTVTGNGYGLAGMRERVSLLHGRFDAGPRAEGGFRVAARFPVPAGTR